MSDHHIVCAECETLINTIIHKTVRKGTKFYHAACYNKEDKMLETRLSKEIFPCKECGLWVVRDETMFMHNPVMRVLQHCNLTDSLTGQDVVTFCGDGCRDLYLKRVKECAAAGFITMV